MFHVKQLQEVFAQASLADRAPAGFFEAAVAHLELVYRWNKVHDLTAVAPKDAPLRHVLDSILPFADLEPVENILDVGSGAGFPGIPLALWWQTSRLHLCEPLRKRRSFLEQVAGALDLDVVSVHEIERTGIAFPDDAQLRFAAAEGRIMITRNRDDFIRLTRDFFQATEPHFGVLVIPHTLPNKEPGRIARASKRWHDGRPAEWGPELYIIDFLVA